LVTIFKNALMITGFVFVMMLVIEYFNVLTYGVWQKRLLNSKRGQYVFAAFLGLTPGCLGSFASATMCSHQMLTIGAVVTTMIVTSGDESFVMLAMIPSKAVFIWAGLFFIGIFVGFFTDILLGKYISRIPFKCEGLEVHKEERLRNYSIAEIFRQWKECSLARGVLFGVLLFFIFAIITGHLGHQNGFYNMSYTNHWNWMNITMLIAALAALYIISTVPDHFLEDHLWKHVFIKHIPQVFLWTFGAILVIHVLGEHLHLENIFMQGRWIILVIACLTGIIPESGPHLIFLTLYVQGNIPISILLANSIVQDGHGMLPLLASSRRMFFIIKGINFAAGLLVGGIALALGF